MLSKRTLVIAGLLVVHFAVIPIAISLTILAYGFEGALTANNQWWTAITRVQGTLLALYLGFGAGGIFKRLPIFLFGLGILLFNSAWAYARLCDLSLPKLKVWLWYVAYHSVWQSPSIVFGAAMIPLRPFVGSIQLKCKQTVSQFRTVDLFAITFIIATTFGGYRFTISDRAGETAYLRSTWMVSAFDMALGLACLLCALSRAWWLGIVLFVGTLIAKLCVIGGGITSIGFVTWMKILYPWAIVMFTLWVYRYLGYQLCGGWNRKFEPNIE